MIVPCNIVCQGKNARKRQDCLKLFKIYITFVIFSEAANMFAPLYSRRFAMFVMAYAPYGAEGIIIRVEADIRRGIPGIDISGLAEGAVREARERVRAAFRNSGFSFPADRILINLAPAGVRKDGASLDLPIALSVMAASGAAPAPENLLVMGELELSGAVRPVRGVLAAIAAGLDAGISDFIVPAGNAREAAILSQSSGPRVASVSTLAEALHVLMVRSDTGELPSIGPPHNVTAPPPQTAGDFADVRGQFRYKRALELAAAGGHNLLVFGPPGAGKTMLARSIPSIMPDLTRNEAVEVTRLHSLAGETDIDLITRPPFRSPHHSASAEGILGGGKTVRPGEISLAHLGVLFLDEAPEFKTNVLQALREPMEDRVLTIVRAENAVRLPADCQLILAANPCPCGRLGIRAGAEAGKNGDAGCLCSPQELSRYWRKFGAAFLDRVELRAAVLPPRIEAMEKVNEESSAVVARRVQAAVDIQRERFCRAKMPDVQNKLPDNLTGSCRRNARIPAGFVDRFCPLNGRAESAFKMAMDKLNLSGRAYHGILRVARTIADLEGKDIIEAVHVLEAVEHRRLGENPYDILELI
jgi:magnesium chelatase family protein